MKVLLILLVLLLLLTVAVPVAARPHSQDGGLAKGHDKSDRCRAKSIQGMVAQGEYRPECLK